MFLNWSILILLVEIDIPKDLELNDINEDDDGDDNSSKGALDDVWNDMGSDMMLQERP